MRSTDRLTGPSWLLYVSQSSGKCFHHVVRNIQVVGVFDQGEAWLATARVPACFDVRFDVEHETVPTMRGLFGDRIEEETEGSDETFLHAWRGTRNQAPPVAVGSTSQTENL